MLALILTAVLADPIPFEALTAPRAGRSISFTFRGSIEKSHPGRVSRSMQLASKVFPSGPVIRISRTTAHDLAPWSPSPSG